MSIAETGHGSVDLDEAARQLEQAVHDAQVAYDCTSLGNLDRAHTNAIIARGRGGERPARRADCRRGPRPRPVTVIAFLGHTVGMRSR
jgi:hypothetical protein